MCELKHAGVSRFDSENSQNKSHNFSGVYLHSIVCRSLGAWRIGAFLKLRGLHLCTGMHMCDRTHMHHTHRHPIIHPHTHTNVSMDIKYQLILTGSGTGGHQRVFTGLCWFMVTDSCAGKWVAERLWERKLEVETQWQWSAQTIGYKPEDSLQRLGGIISALL